MRVSRILICGLAVLTAAVLSAAPARAENIGEVLIPQSLVERHGLTRSWFMQLPLAGMRSKIVAIVPDDDLLLITTTNAEVMAVDSETGRLVWSTQVGDPRQPTFPAAGNGNPIYRKAHWKPETKAKQGTTAKPTAAPVAVGGAAAGTTPAAADGYGPPAIESKSPAATAWPLPDNLVVAVVNGTRLYLLDRADGRPHMDAKSKQAWVTHLRNLPRNGAMVAEEFVYVPTANGHIETYAINDVNAGVTYVTSSGRNLHPPVIAGQRVAWISDRGSVHLTMPDGITPKFEVDLGGPAAAQLAVHSPFIFAANSDGDLFCIHDTEGALIWKFPTGSPIREAPIAIRNVIYALPEDAGLACVAISDGHEEWVNSSPRHFLAASPTKVYTVDRFNRMLILDGKAGGTLDTIPLPTDVRPLANIQTDRILLSSESGMLQCLHETMMPEPAYYPIRKMAMPKPVAAVVSRPKPADNADNPKPAPKPAPKPKKKADDADAPPAKAPKKAKAAANQ